MGSALVSKAKVAIRSFGYRLVQCSLMEFCGIRSRQARHDHNTLRHHEAFEASLAHALKLLLAQSHSLLDNDKRFDRLPEEFVGNANDRGLPNARNIYQHVLHFLGGDLLSSGLY